MQIKLSLKLFGAFFLILAIVVGAMILSKYIFSKNFKAYIHQTEMEKLKNLVPVFQEEYRANGSWNRLSSEPWRLHRLIKIFPDRWENVPPHPPKTEFRDGSMHPPDRHTPSKNGPPPGFPGLLLLDAMKQPIIGIPEPSERIHMTSVTVDGQIVGWLGMQMHEPFKSGPPAVLLERQTRQLFLLGSAVIAITAFIALMFSRHLLKPIQKLTWGTQELANRNFSARITRTTRDELGLLAENFNAMAQTLEKFENMRRQWLTDISHELRTPLAILRGEIESFQDGVRKPTPANLGSLHDEILRISRLVEDLHLLSMMDSDDKFLDKKRISPVEVLEKIVENYKPRYDQCGIHFILGIDDIKYLRIRGDGSRLEQVFTNILENACKYVPPDGTMKIQGKVDDQVLTLDFQDSGPGVPEEDLSKLFDRLYRADNSRTRNSGGSGLGLSICRQIVEKHGGKIWAENSPLGGLSIVVELPI